MRCWTGPTLAESRPAFIGGAARSGRSGSGSSRLWDEVRIEIVDGPVEVEVGVVVVENVTYLRGRDGIEVQARSAWLTTIRDGETTSLTMYQTKQEALEAAGLRK
jgi:ketosteroid isomerase-like protein